ncbi:MAG: hypothetical protein ABW003_09360 [Microvirga sp.]
MTYNWELSPPIPACGDDDPDVVFRGVGKVMTGWETIEFELSRLYSVFAGDPDGEAMREYGENTIARLRLDALSRKADEFFIRKPSQEREGKFASIICQLRFFASRRNEVAHGIVFDVQKIKAFTEHFHRSVRGKPQYALIAPYHQLKQHAPDGLPAYAYTSLILEAMIPAMAKPFAQLDRFRRSLLAREKSPSVLSRPSAGKEKKRRRNVGQRRG